MAKVAGLYSLGIMDTFLVTVLNFEREETKGTYEVGRWRGVLAGAERLIVAYDRSRNVHGEPISQQHRENPNKQVRVVVQGGLDSERLQAALRGRFIAWKRSGGCDDA